MWPVQRDGEGAETPRSILLNPISKGERKRASTLPVCDFDVRKRADRAPYEDMYFFIRFWIVAAEKGLTT